MEITYFSVISLKVMYFFEKAFGTRLEYNDENLEKLKEINRLFNHTFGPGSSRIVDGLQWFNIFKNKEYDTMKKALGLRNTFWSEYRRKVNICYFGHHQDICTLS